MKARARYRVIVSLLVGTLSILAAAARGQTASFAQSGGHQNLGHEHQEHEHAEHGQPEHEGGSHSEQSEGMRHEGAVDHSFADAEAWAERFEGAERDEWQQPERVVAALDLNSGMTVADIGSGTGYFARRFAAAVGPEGTVFAADVEPEMGAYVRKRADEDGQANVVPVLASYDDPRLPDGAVDLIFVCNTWHHIRDRVDYARRLAADLKPGGRIVILDFVEGELPFGPSAEQKLSAEDVAAEFEAAGYRLADTFEGLPYQYLLTFEPGGGAN